MTGAEISGLIFAGLVVVAVLFSLRSRRQDLGHRSPQNILEEVEVLLAYGLYEKAIRLLREARISHPGHDEIRERLAELESLGLH